MEALEAVLEVVVEAAVAVVCSIALVPVFGELCACVEEVLDSHRARCEDRDGISEGNTRWLTFWLGRGGFGQRDFGPPDTVLGTITSDHLFST